MQKITLAEDNIHVATIEGDSTILYCDTLTNIKVTYPELHYIAVTSPMYYGVIKLRKAKGLITALNRISRSPRTSFAVYFLYHNEEYIRAARSCFTNCVINNIGNIYSDKVKLVARLNVLLACDVTDIVNIANADELDIKHHVVRFVKHFYGYDKFKDGTDFEAFPLKTTFDWDSIDIQNWVGKHAV